MTKQKKVNEKNLEFEQLKNKTEEYLDGWKRARADYENLKKQTEREKTEFVKFANANLVFGLIPVYNNLKLALKHAPQNNQWAKGVEQVKNQFKQVLEHNGVEEIIPQEGDKFNTEIHEAVEHTDKTRIKPNSYDNKISKVVSTGYKLNGKVFVPAKVVVE